MPFLLENRTNIWMIYDESFNPVAVCSTLEKAERMASAFTLEDIDNDRAHYVIRETYMDERLREDKEDEEIVWNSTYYWMYVYPQRKVE
ncbi:MAG: hypothetical protein EOP45_11285 [Sphingobacteriaceae bacterium]|nr:MAG: hypothetical protein EOP45_11285 [Sphingobacteriaceae bacterium]